MGALQLTVEREKLRLAEPFRISGYVFEETEVVVATVSDGEHGGRGEGGGVYYLNDDADRMVADIEAARPAIEAGIDRQELRALMPACGGRNAVDCALWELEAKRAGKAAWQLAGIDKPAPLVTTFTCGADEPAAMAAKALSYEGARAIKIKLTGDLALDLERVGAIRAALPKVWIGVDANQGFSIAELPELVTGLETLDVALVEQPLARGREADMEGFESSIPLAADESALTLDDVPEIAGRFDVFNIKLDKCGGLTEALMIAEACRKSGLKVMVGNMVGTSLAMAPAFIVGQYCDVVDLDGPTFLARDREPSIDYRDGTVFAGPRVWGGSAE
ncbi:dipeptide epimerase [Qipengyuania sp. MTN3-11]|uniref:dipeptide epimerase n=1 Tax=Qipengyuania sp. MTN3-11 TaxID=3056557 RepID=UPI0036F24ED5